VDRNWKKEEARGFYANMRKKGEGTRVVISEAV
jgi:hypothetical protein